MTLAEKKKKRAERSIAAVWPSSQQAAGLATTYPGLFRVWTRWCVDDFVYMLAWADGGCVCVHALALALARGPCGPLPPASSVY